MPPAILVIQHGPQVPPGYVETALMASGVDYEIALLHTGSPVPGVAGWDGIVSLGGAMGAYDEADYPYLIAEKELLRDAVAVDPVVGAMTDPALTFHQDTWDLPPGGVLLAATDMYPQAFRLGSAVGIQSHPEAPPELIADWMVSEVGERHLVTAGVDGRAIVTAMGDGRAESEAMADRLFAAWLGEVAQHCEASAE